MSRSTYSDDLDNWSIIRWSGAVTSAIRGKRGQAFLRELLSAMDALESKRLIAGELEDSGEFCALGTVGHTRGMEMATIDPEDPEHVARRFGISPALAMEIVFWNDDCGPFGETPEQRFCRIREWVADKIVNPEPPEAE